MIKSTKSLPLSLRGSSLTMQQRIPALSIA
jgi:hypothetical protein